jgi:hypothetical protein
MHRHRSETSHAQQQHRDEGRDAESRFDCGETAFTA